MYYFRDPQTIEEGCIAAQNIRILSAWVRKPSMKNSNIRASKILVSENLTFKEMQEVETFIVDN